MVTGTIIESILQNWVVISITVFVTLIAAVLSNRGIKKRFESAEQKDKQKGVEELRTIIEDLIVTNRSTLSRDDVDLDDLGLSSNRIEDLIEAAERKYGVSLSKSVTPISILQDVDLRIKDSRHLDPNQKNQHSKAISTIVGELSDTGQEKHILSDRAADALDRIETNAEYDGYESDVAELREQTIPYSKIASSYKYRDRMRKLMVSTIALVASITTLMVAISETSDAEQQLASPDMALIISVGIVMLIVPIVLIFDKNNMMKKLFSVIYS